MDAVRHPLTQSTFDELVQPRERQGAIVRPTQLRRPPRGHRPTDGEAPRWDKLSAVAFLIVGAVAMVLVIGWERSSTSRVDDGRLLLIRAARQGLVAGRLSLISNLARSAACSRRLRPLAWPFVNSRRMAAPLAAALVVVAAALIAIAIVYLVVPATHLPSFLPGHEAVRHAKRTGRALPSSAHTSRGVLVFVLALGTIAAAWWTAFRYRPAHGAF